MVLNRSYTIEKDNMPQTVPSAGYTPPCDYSAFAADSFDLSLLPPSPPGGQNDADFPLSPSTLLYTSSPPSMFGASFDTKNIKPPQIYTSFYPNSPPLDSKENIFDDIATKNIYSSFQQQQSPLLTVLKEEPNTNQYLTPSFPLSAPISPPSSCTSYSNHSSPIYPQSVSPAHQIKHENTLDLQESLEDFRFVQKSFEAEKFGTNTTYQDPFSPQGNFSPHAAQSPFRDNFNGQLSPESLTSRQVPENIYQSFIGIDTKDVKKNSDHQLLREVLRDTSFQKKYNLRPFDFGGLVTGFVDSIKMEEPDNSVQRRAENGSNGTGDGDGARQGEDLLMSSCHEELTRERIEPVLSLAIEQMRKDVDNTCSALGISPDPTRWTKEDVKAWLLWTLQQFTLAPIQMDYFNMDGQMMASLTEEEFTQRTPQNGSILHAQLEIWKAACADTDLGGMSSSSSTPLQQGSTTTTAGPSGVLPGSSTTGATTSSAVPTQWTPTPSSTHSSTSSRGDISEDEEEDTASTIPSTVGPSTHSGVGKATPSRGASGGGSHIHLWQFLKELLASPTLYGSAIRWLDRGKGVFKIEDSVRVARLWGKRKNRPAMNYDKLSRSIRQYYKKGIMKKTERSQRLVYQFCHPYSL